MFLTKFVFDAVRKRYSTGSVLSTLVECSIRFCQFVFGIAVIGLYSQDLVRAKNKGDPMDAKWLYVTVVGSLASFSSLLYLILPCVTRRPFGMVHYLHIPGLVHDSILCVLWLTAFGMFGKKFISVPDDDDDKSDITRMKNAVWVDLISLSLWVITAAWWGLRWAKSRKQAKQGERLEDENQPDMRSV